MKKTGTKTRRGKRTERPRKNQDGKEKKLYNVSEKRQKDKVKFSKLILQEEDSLKVSC